MKTKILKLHFMVVIFALFACDCFGMSVIYLKPLHLKISSRGINRLNFGDDRIVKIVGDSSQYSALLSDNGSDLFLTSKVAALGVIDLTLITGRSESVDLRLEVSDSSDGAIININLGGENNRGQREREEISMMINAMKSNNKGKYFVEEKKRIIKIKKRADIKLKQYVSYRYGELWGAGFSCKVKKGSLGISAEDIRGLFKYTLAISILNIDEKGKEARAFVVFKAGEGMDV